MLQRDSCSTRIGDGGIRGVLRRIQFWIRLPKRAGTVDRSIGNSRVPRPLEIDLIWLPVMYLSSLNIRIIDGNNSEVLATARFNATMNTFPRSQTVVANLFTQLDRRASRS